MSILQKCLLSIEGSVVGIVTIEDHYTQGHSEGANNAWLDEIDEVKVDYYLSWIHRDPVISDASEKLTDLFWSSLIYNLASARLYHLL